MGATEIPAGKGQGYGSSRPTRASGAPSAHGSKSALRAADLGLELSDAALEALATVPLRAAMDLLDDVAVKGNGKGKGGIRNPSGYVIKACNVMNYEQEDDYGYAPICPAAKGGHKGANNLDIQTRVVELNRIGNWDGEKIDVEAMMVLKELPPHRAHELLDSLESKAHIKNPSNYIACAVSRMHSVVADVSRKRPWSSEGYIPLSAELGRRLSDMGVELTDEAASTLAAQNLEDANELLDQFSSKLGMIKDPSKYLMAACNRGITTFPQDEGYRAAKWQRT